MSEENEKRLHLRIELDGTDSAREVVLPAALTLDWVHYVIQTLFGWLSYHEYEFQQGNTIYSGNPPAGDELDIIKAINESNGTPARTEAFAKEATLGAILKRKGAKLDYAYDMGDYNEHTIILVDPKPEAAPFTCVKTEGPDAVEDSRGFGGLPGILKSLNDPKAKNRKELVRWLKEAFDLTPEDVVYEPTLREQNRALHAIARIWYGISDDSHPEM